MDKPEGAEPETTGRRSPGAQKPHQLWNSLVIVKLVLSLATPVALLLVGEGLRRDAAAVRNEQVRAARIVDKRYDLYADLGLPLNQLYSYYEYVGVWKELQPTDIVAIKRKLDSRVYTYRFLFSPDFVKRYEALRQAAFCEFGGWGVDARLRTTTDHRKEVTKWQASWDSMFTGEDNRRQIDSLYTRLMEELAVELDVRFDTRPDRSVR
jgi:hypothetical protein